MIQLHFCWREREKEIDGEETIHKDREKQRDKYLGRKKNKKKQTKKQSKQENNSKSDKESAIIFTLFQIQI